MMKNTLINSFKFVNVSVIHNIEPNDTCILGFMEKEDYKLNLNG